MMIAVVLIFTLLAVVSTENVTSPYETCDLAPWDASPWEKAIEDWATSASKHSGREARILSLPPANGYYVTDRIDGNLLTPPPVIPIPRPYEEWHQPASGPGKIVNKPPNYYVNPNPNKDKFKPSHPPPQPNQQYPSNQQYPNPQQYPSNQQYPNPQQYPSNQQYPNPQQYAKPETNRPAADRVDSPPPQKLVSETDLMLLRAMEKLTYRMDIMEKRVRKLEESIHILVAGEDPKPEPCVNNFTRVAGDCYHFSNEPVDWKSANLACRKLRANLLELDGNAKKRQLTAAMQTDKLLKDKDWWTGGLNPGLLWIWSHSARPLYGNTTSTNSTEENFTIIGEGRCLALVYDPATKSHVYRGQDCGYRHRYVCEKEEDKTKLSNEIVRVARKLKSLDASGRKPKIMWTDGLM